MLEVSVLLHCELFIHLKALSSMSSCPDQIKLLLDRQEKLHERQSELKALLESCESSSGPGDDNAAVSVDDWSRPFVWDSQADDIRFNVFGISKYRANQREVGPSCLHLLFTGLILQGFACLQKLYNSSLRTSVAQSCQHKTRGLSMT